MLSSVHSVNGGGQQSGQGLRRGQRPKIAVAGGRQNSSFNSKSPKEFGGLEASDFLSSFNGPKAPAILAFP
jgi:hypothetical protein